MSWIDVHTHLDLVEGMSTKEVLEEAKMSSVKQMITIGTCPKDHPIVLDLAREFSPYVACALGVHPHEARFFDDESEVFMRKNLTLDFVVAVGEIGLDYYYNHSDPVEQRDVFRKQIEMALEFNLPIEIHTRDAESDTVKILKEWSSSHKIRGLIHCFTGSEWLADEALSLGLNLSFSGIITFKNASSLREVVKKTPLDRLHVETDAPFLTPHPFRGKKNRPSYIGHTASKVAEIKEVSLESLSEKTIENSRKLFEKLKPI